MYEYVNYVYQDIYCMIKKTYPSDRPVPPSTFFGRRVQHMMKKGHNSLIQDLGKIRDQKDLRTIKKGGQQDLKSRQQLVQNA